MTLESAAQSVWQRDTGSWFQACGPATENAVERCLRTFFGPDSVHVQHLLCCLFHINHTSHQPWKKRK